MPKEKFLYDENALKTLSADQEAKVTYEGPSMNPLLVDGDVLRCKAASVNNIFCGDLIIFSVPEQKKVVVHRYLGKQTSENGTTLITKADNSIELDQPVPDAKLHAKVVKIEREGRVIWENVGSGLAAFKIIGLFAYIESVVWGGVKWFLGKVLRMQKDKIYSPAVRKTVLLPKKIILYSFKTVLR